MILDTQDYRMKEKCTHWIGLNHSRAPFMLPACLSGSLTLPLQTVLQPFHKPLHSQGKLPFQIHTECWIFELKMSIPAVWFTQTCSTRLSKLFSTGVLYYCTWELQLLKFEDYVFPQNFLPNNWYFADLPTQLKEKIIL